MASYLAGRHFSGTVATLQLFHMRFAVLRYTVEHRKARWQAAMSAKPKLFREAKIYFTTDKIAHILSNI